MNILKAREDIRNGKTIYNMKLNVCYYARVSTDKIEQINSINNQKKYFEDYIKGNPNWNLVNSYIDEGISGIKVKNRLSFIKMIEDAKKGKIDLILTKEISRFSRNTLDSIKYTRELLNYGVIVYFLSDNINTISEDSELRLTIMSSLAQDEIRRLSQRVKFGIKRMIKDRKLIGSNLTGYYKKNGKYIINKQEAKMIKYLFQTYSKGNISLKQISDNLYSMGYTNIKGKPYSQTTLSKMITNPRYKGFYTAHLTEVIDYKTHKKINICKEEQIIEKDNNIPKIISEELWNRVNKLYLERKQRKSNNIINSNKLLNSKYTHLIYCTHCNNIYIRTRTNPVWVCKTYKTKGISKCKSPIIKEIVLDNILVNIINDILNEKESIINNILEDYKNLKTNNSYLNEKEYILNQKDKLLNLFLNNIINEIDFNSKNKELDTKLENMKEENYIFNESSIRYFIINKLNVKNNLEQLIKLFIKKIEIEKINNNRKYICIKIYFNFNKECTYIKLNIT